MNRSTIVSGNYSLASYDLNGVQFGANPIERKITLSQQSVIANGIYTWDISRIQSDLIPEVVIINHAPFSPFTLFIGATKGADILFASSFTEADAQNNGTISFITLPELIFSREWEIGFTLSKDATSVSTICRRIDGSEVYPANKIQLPSS